MKLAIINGSPRNKKSNSKILIEQFLKGYSKVCADPVPIHYLASNKTRGQGTEILQNAETILLIFPLYTDCMPGIVKEFMEDMVNLKFVQTKKIGFIVQSGFPEAIHSVYLAKYLEKLSKRLHFEYLGTIIKGGVEGIQIMPSWMTKKLFQRFEDLGEYFAKNLNFDPSIKKELAKPYKMTFIRRFVYNIMKQIGLTNFYWNSYLKKNNAYLDRFARPYEKIKINLS